jgi:hypothetical protein
VLVCADRNAYAVHYPKYIIASKPSYAPDVKLVIEAVIVAKEICPRVGVYAALRPVNRDC